MSGTNLGTATLIRLDTATIGVKSRLSVVDEFAQDPGATATESAFGPTYAGGGASFYARPPAPTVDRLNSATVRSTSI